MALFPSEQVATAWADLAALQTWVGVDPAAMDAVTAQTGALGNRVRNLALLPPQVIEAAVAAAQVPGTEGATRHLSPIEASHVGVCWRLARRLAWRAAGGDNTWDNYQDVDPLIPQQPPAPVIQQQQAQTQAATQLVSKKLKMSALVEQGDETESQLGNINTVSVTAEAPVNEQNQKNVFNIV